MEICYTIIDRSVGRDKTMSSPYFYIDFRCKKVRIERGIWMEEKNDS